MNIGFVLSGKLKRKTPSTPPDKLTHSAAVYVALNNNVST